MIDSHSNVIEQRKEDRRRLELRQRGETTPNFLRVFVLIGIIDTHTHMHRKCVGYQKHDDHVDDNDILVNEQKNFVGFSTGVNSGQ